SLQQQLRARRQTLRLDLPDGIPVVWADAARVSQVLTNLLSNAHKYTPAEGSIEVAVRAEADQVRVDVTDTGIGLSDEEQEQLFRKFYRARHPEVQEVVGTGLGLAITRSLVERHGGAMAVRSTPGNGSTFTITLPLGPQTG